MLPSREATKSLQECRVRERHEWKVARDGVPKLGYLTFVPLSIRGVLVDVDVTQREPTRVADLKSKSVLEKLGCIQVPE